MKYKIAFMKFSCLYLIHLSGRKQRICSELLKAFDYSSIENFISLAGEFSVVTHTAYLRKKINLIEDCGVYF